MQDFSGTQTLMPSYAPILILGAAAFFCLAVGVLLVTLFVVVIFWETDYRLAVLGGFALLYLAVGIIGNARERYPIKFYLVCMIFILLDVDAAFLYPWALNFRELGVFGLVEMGVFMALLGGGFVYAWKSDALDW